MTQKTNPNPWTMDVRVRERNLKSGALTDKDLEKHLAALPDVADQSEPFGIPQPALTDQPQHVPPPAPREVAVAPAPIEAASASASDIDETVEAEAEIPAGDDDLSAAGDAGEVHHDNGVADSFVGGGEADAGSDVVGGDIGGGESSGGGEPT